MPLIFMIWYPEFPKPQPPPFLPLFLLLPAFSLFYFLLSLFQIITAFCPLPRFLSVPLPLFLITPLSPFGGVSQFPFLLPLPSLSSHTHFHHDGLPVYWWTDPQLWMADLPSKRFWEVSFDFPHLDYLFSGFSLVVLKFWVRFLLLLRVFSGSFFLLTIWGVPQGGHNNLQYSVNINLLEKPQMTWIPTSYRSHILVLFLCVWFDVFIVYTLYKVIIKYWLYSLCCTLHAHTLFILYPVVCMS